MRIKLLFTFSALVFFLGPPAFLPSSTHGAEKVPAEGDIRPSILAGSWYPGEASRLTAMIEGFLSKVHVQSMKGRLKALIVPHAGYRYSGQVAAHAYALLRGKVFRRVILVGPSHRMPFRGVSVNLQGGYETPLGVVPVNRNLARRILDAAPFIRWVKGAHGVEHSLEIQLPFLQRVLTSFQMVPILMGQQDYETCKRLADVLTGVLGEGAETLLVASTDLSHYHRSQRAEGLDRVFVGHIRRFDPEGLALDLSRGRCEACGGGPAITILLASRRLGATRSLILKVANSGDVTHDYQHVVGYMAAALLTER